MSLLIASFRPMLRPWMIIIVLILMISITPKMDILVLVIVTGSFVLVLNKVHMPVAITVVIIISIPVVKRVATTSPSSVLVSIVVVIVIICNSIIVRFLIPIIVPIATRDFIVVVRQTRIVRNSGTFPTRGITGTVILCQSSRRLPINWAVNVSKVTKENPNRHHCTCLRLHFPNLHFSHTTGKYPNDNKRWN